jgi:hypothetical protein
LKAYWELQERLAKGGYLAGGRTPAKALDELLQKVADGGEPAKLLVEAKVVEKPEDAAKGIEELLAER